MLGPINEVSDDKSTRVEIIQKIILTDPKFRTWCDDQPDEVRGLADTLYLVSDVMASEYLQRLRDWSNFTRLSGQHFFDQIVGYRHKLRTEKLDGSSFQNRLRVLRWSCGLTKCMFAEMVAIDPSLYRTYELDGRQPSIEFAERVRPLDVDFNWLFNGTDCALKMRSPLPPVWDVGEQSVTKSNVVKTTSESIAVRLRSTRRQVTRSKSEFARIIGININTLVRIERDTTGYLRYYMLRETERVSGVDLNWLLFGSADRICSETGINEWGLDTHIVSEPERADGMIENVPKLLVERLEILRDMLKLTKKSFAERFGLSVCNYSTMLRREANVNVSVFLRFENTPINMNWLIAAKGSMIRPIVTSVTETNIN